MRPICPSCGYIFDLDAPEGQLYRCSQCREFFHVKEDLEHITKSSENIEGATPCTDLKAGQKGEIQFTPDTTTRDKETLVDTVDMPNNIKTEGKVQIPERTMDDDEIGHAPLSGRMQVPAVVLFYGEMIMGVNALGMLVALGAMILVLVQSSGEAKAMGAVCLVLFLISTYFYSIGKGLRNGDRDAVYAWCIIAMLGVFVSIVYRVYMPNLVLLGIVGLFYFPPIISAFRHWEAFSKKKRKRK